MSDSDAGAGMRARANAAVRSGARPVVLKIAELFLILIVGMYLAKAIMIGIGMFEGYGYHRTSLLTYIVEVVMLFITADSLMVVSSRHPKAWKKVVRAAMLLIIFNLIYWFGSSSITAAAYVVVNPLIITPMALIIMAIMYWEPIRRYYMPHMEEEKSAWDWFKFSWFSPLYTSGGYRVMYDDEEQD